MVVDLSRKTDWRVCGSYVSSYTPGKQSWLNWSKSAGVSKIDSSDVAFIDFEDKHFTLVMDSISEGQSESSLLKVIYCLIRLSRSTNEQTAQEAGCCLGEVGPTDLSIIALRDRTHSSALAMALKKYTEQTDENSKRKQYCHIFHLLDSYLVDARCML